MVPWFSTLGFQSSHVHWGDYAYGRSDSAVTRGISATGLPENLVIDSPEYWRIQEREAIRQIRQMHQAGMDAVLIDQIPRPKLYRPEAFKGHETRTHPTEHFKLLGVWLAAAKAVSREFKVGIYLESVQRTSEEPAGSVPTAREWVSIISRLLSVYGDHPNLLRIDGKPCIVSFGTSEIALSDASGMDWSGGWHEVIRSLDSRGTPVHFVSDIRPRVAKLDVLRNWVALSGAVHLFAPAAPISFGTRYQKKISDSVTRLGGTYWWSVYPGYYRHERDYSPPDFRRIHELWVTAMESRAPVVQILTWNDIAERHDIWPSDLNQSVPLRLMSWYAKWFKTGAKPIMRENLIFLACPVQIRNDVRAARPGWPGYPADPQSHDSCFYWAAIRNSIGAEISIKRVGTVKLPNGVSFGVMGRVRHAGKLSVHVTSGEKTRRMVTRRIIDGQGKSEQLLYFYKDISPAKAAENG